MSAMKHIGGSQKKFLSAAGGEKRESYSPSHYGSIYDSADDAAANSNAPLLGNKSQRSSLKGSHGSRNNLATGVSSATSDKRSSRKQVDDNSGGSGGSVEVFNEDAKLLNRSLRTGRQRKKLAARSKGGEFQARRRKRRVYFCCICSEIDIPKMFDYLTGAEELFFSGWEFSMYGDVLHMFKPGLKEVADLALDAGLGAPPAIMRVKSLEDAALIGSGSRGFEDLHIDLERQNTFGPDSIERMRSETLEDGAGTCLSDAGSERGSRERVAEQAEPPTRSREDSRVDTGAAPGTCRISAVGAQEVFVFDFGAAVFWGFSRGEEARIIKAIRMFVTKGTVVGAEFESGEDDMAFVTLPEADAISVSNDVITLPETSSVKQRLSVSFAIAQSTVLAIFESRIESKIEEYKYIPETLAACGKVQLSQRQLGVMIGEVFVIRHDVNLHSEILDTPDFFWKEEKYEQEYRMIFDYLEMKSRTDVSNTRLDMLRELLDVLQSQMENAHAVKLEWIVIWLIVTEVVLQMVAIFGTDQPTKLM